MSISAPRYAAGPIELTSRERRALAVFLHEMREQAGWTTWLVVAISYLAIVLAVVIQSELTATAGLLAGPGAGPLSGGVRVSTFHIAYAIGIWPFLVLLVATAVGSGSLADDLANRSIALYLSRPIHLSDYIGAKVAAVATWIGIVAVGPGLVGVTIVAALGLSSLNVSLAALGAFVAVGLLTTFFFTALAIALSALSGRALYAGVGIFGTTLSAFISANAVLSVTGRTLVLYISPLDDIRSAAAAAFQTGESTGIDPWIATAILLAVSAFLSGVAWLRMRRVEVVGE